MLLGYINTQHHFSGLGKCLWTSPNYWDMFTISNKNLKVDAQNRQHGTWDVTNPCLTNHLGKLIIHQPEKFGDIFWLVVLTILKHI